MPTLPLLAALMVPLLYSLAAASLRVSPPGPPPRPVLVTIDDLPVASGRLHTDPAERKRITTDLLAVLGKHRVPAVGLVVWSGVRGPEDRQLLEEWLAAGHELGSHSDRHLDYTRTEAAAYIADVESARAGLSAFLATKGRKLRFFRFPFLREGNTPEKLEAMRTYLAETGQRNLPVTIDDQDWSFEEPWVTANRARDQRALARIAEEYQSALRRDVGSHSELADSLLGRANVPQILLIHANEIGAAQLDGLFGWMQANGYRFAAADEVLADPAFSMPHGYVGDFGPSLWHRLQSDRRRDQAREAVLKILADQAAAWNRGDLVAFCSVYTEDAAFASSSGLTQGRQAVLERYQKKYPDAASRGTLALEPIETRLAIGTEVSGEGNAVPSKVHAVSVVARWTLTYPSKPAASGLTLLVFHRRESEWRIVQDASI